jgi:hypothetical protein
MRVLPTPFSLWFVGFQQTTNYHFQAFEKFGRTCTYQSGKASHQTDLTRSVTLTATL